MSRITSRLILLTSVGGKESLRTDESERDDEKRKCGRRRGVLEAPAY